MFDRGLLLTLQAMRRQLSAMPHDLYLIRLIHHQTRRAFPGERLWNATQLLHPATVRFLRGRNREGCDIYIQPFTDHQNPGYILVDLDHTSADTIPRMRANGHAPCVVLQTSPGNLQVWVHVSTTPVPPVAASFIGKQLAQCYDGDLASTDWRHLGRLAGFSNQKPQRRNRHGYAPWVKVMYAQAGLAEQGAALLQQAETARNCPAQAPLTLRGPALMPVEVNAASHPAAVQIYADWLRRLQIRERFPQTDWSIADKWIAKELLRRGISTADVTAILRGGSPGFPRRHSDPEDYLCRTLTRAARELQ